MYRMIWICSFCACLKSCFRLTKLIWSLFLFFSRTIIDTTGSTLSRTLSNTLGSSTASSQDSLHKHQKKKGIKSSIGRLFSKKEKAKQKDAMGREMIPAGKRIFPFFLSLWDIQNSSVFLHILMFLCLSVSICLSVSFCLSLCLSVCIYLSVCLSLSEWLRLPTSDK